MLLAIATIVMLAVAYFVFFSRVSEPTYDGRPLSEWIAIRGTHRGKISSDAEFARATLSIRKIGANALPLLLKWLDYEREPWNQRYRSKTANLPLWIAESDVMYWLLEKKEERQKNAMKAFEVLGPIAAPAVPELHRLVCRTNAPETAERALTALASIGPAAVPAVIDILSTTHFSGHWIMQNCLGILGTNAAPVVPILIKNLRNPDEQVAQNSALSLGAVGCDPERSVSALIEVLGDPRPKVRKAAITALLSFGSSARDALPALTNFLNDPDPNISFSAMEAINTITGKTQE